MQNKLTQSNYFEDFPIMMSIINLHETHNGTQIEPGNLLIVITVTLKQALSCPVPTSPSRLSPIPHKACYNSDLSANRARRHHQSIPRRFISTVMQSPGKVGQRSPLPIHVHCIVAECISFSKLKPV